MLPGNCASRGCWSTNLACGDQGALERSSQKGEQEKENQDCSRQKEVRLLAPLAPSGASVCCDAAPLRARRLLTVLRVCVHPLPAAEMIYSCIAFSVLISGAEAFSAGVLRPHAATGARSAMVNMQVAEAEVASPVSLAKVRPTPRRARVMAPLPLAVVADVVLSSCRLCQPAAGLRGTGVPVALLLHPA
jgi:hypothetical protein